MENAYLSAATNLVAAQARTKSMTTEEMMTSVEEVARRLEAMDNTMVKGTIAPTSAAQAPILVVNPKTAIKDGTVACCICGEPLKVLTKVHLAKHDLTPESYRKLCGYPVGHPLACKSLTKARREKMQEMRLWEKRKAPATA